MYCSVRSDIIIRWSLVLYVSRYEFVGSSRTKDGSRVTEKWQKWRSIGHVRLRFNYYVLYFRNLVDCGACIAVRNLLHCYALTLRFLVDISRGGPPRWSTNEGEYVNSRVFVLRGNDLPVVRLLHGLESSMIDAIDLWNPVLVWILRLPSTVTFA